MDYKLPKELHQQTLWFIRRYPQMLVKYHDVIWKGKEMDGMPRGGGISDPTSRDAIELVEYGEDLSVIENALSRIPEEYRKGVFQKIVYRKEFPDYAHLNTWKRYKREFIYHVARGKKWI